MAQGSGSGLRLRALQRQRLEGNVRTLQTEGEKKELGGVGGMDWELGTSRCKLLYIRWINIKDL